MELLRLLRSARWLSTGQVHRRFFAPATLSATRRRLRRLARAGYITKHQKDRMREAMFTLGRHSKRLLEKDGSTEVVLERHPPKQLEHMAGINDIRIASETAGELAFFFAAWELPAMGWKFTMVPDAVFRVGDRTFAVEYDRGLEGLRYFVGSKIAWYRAGLAGFPLAGVLVVTDGEARMRTLARAIGVADRRFFCTTIDLIRREGMPTPVTGTPTCSSETLRRENSLAEKSSFESASYRKTRIAS